MAKKTTSINQADGKDKLLAAVLATLYAQNMKPDFKGVARFLGVSYDAAEGRLRQSRRAAEALVEEANAGKLPPVQTPKRKLSSGKVSKPVKKGQSSDDDLQGGKRKTKAKNAKEESSDDDLSLWESVLNYEGTVNPADVEV
ncbi:hypothetical protein PRZ48_005292 [Zasmidium cellare]|uniref:Uncharacterized protein n=1 Tax=Zasmidium cellare TaxID=395010 RepID=A0ABR0ES09_ZASCE|nr:hypothetical protein PRZ48_005292 [Zasmidium cellare]